MVRIESPAANGPIRNVNFDGLSEFNEDFFFDDGDVSNHKEVFGEKMQTIST